MDYKVLYRKYRPMDFDSVSGQDYTVKILKKSIENNKISHAYLFTGPRGTGKTSTAKIFAKATNCLDLKKGNPCGKCDSCLNINNNPDIIELDAASNNGVDEIRDIIESVKIAPSFSKYKVYVIDEVHMLTPNAFNALLLTLEEPPGNVVFILATTDVQKVPITILSRCQRFDFKSIDNESIVNRLKYVCTEEKIEIDDDALSEIAYISNGGLRDALSILDQLASNENKITLEDVYSNFGTVSSVKIKKLVNNYILGNIKEIIKLINEFKENGTNYVVLIEKIIEELKKIAIDIKCNNDDSVSFDNVYDLIVDLNKCLNNININLNPYILIELTILKYINKQDEIILYDFDKKSDNSQKKDEKPTEEVQNISREIKSEDIEVQNEEKEEKNKDSEYFLGNNEEFDKSLINIRINNCFVGAEKKYKTEMLELWSEFLEYIAENFKVISSIMNETSIGMASSNYAVLITKKDSIADMVNQKIELVSEIFKELYDQEYKFICIDEKSWEIEMENFKKKKTSGEKYVLMEEKTQDKKDNSSELDSIANDLFGDDVVEYN